MITIDSRRKDGKQTRSEEKKAVFDAKHKNWTELALEQNREAFPGRIFIENGTTRRRSNGRLIK